MKSDSHNCILVSADGARALDAEASAEWGLEPFALVEAAGRACASVFTRKFLKGAKGKTSFTVLAGSGNNAADALVMLKALILGGYAPASDCAVFATRLAADGKSPLSQAMRAVQKLGVQTMEWHPQKAPDAFCKTGFIIDGITGTGLNDPLRNTALEMIEAVNLYKNKVNVVNHNKNMVNRPLIISIDIPSGSFDKWRQGMPILSADATLAIEPQKLCLYAPLIRPHAGTILPVTGIFPPALSGKYREAELVTWESACVSVPPVPKTAHKYERGLAEIWAGSQGAAGAANLAARGAQAAGAGLVRLIVDPSIYPIVAPNCSGVMAAAGPQTDGRFPPTAVLLGPGWGKSEDRVRILENCLRLEEQGFPLILDADAIALAKDMVFHGNAILTPHIGEFAAYSGLHKDEILESPIRALRGFCAKIKAVILLKSHVMYAAAPDGRIGIIDGMNPALATGGSGDVLAGFCCSIAARWKALVLKNGAENGAFDAFTCACAAGALLIQAAKGVAGKFADPAEIAQSAAVVAGAAWMEA
ncbi:MAG: bifunctional ADP-dependent NAD(P)H-hydrate dehydratase/NAD(P)H-hydrate epimerase [Treponema sp.]|nr:bifunctional ADP-dependent NAD(P)H-hydrate dehydratase/NAD(P)H-hydrate epimerase [Treponema sp.]